MKNGLLLISNFLFNIVNARDEINRMPNFSTGDMRLRLLFRILICASFLCLSTPPPLHAAERDAVYILQQIIDRLFTKRISSRALTAVKVASAATGEVLYERNASALLTPASTMKLFTSAAALATLGRGYPFRTLVSSDDTSRDVAVIHGNLFLQGFGDPYLTSADLKNLATYLSKRGLREVEGDIEGDESFFDHASACNNENGRAYSSIRLPHLSSLTVDMNLLVVVLSPAKKKGAKVIVGFPAGGSFFKVINRTTCVKMRVRYRPRVKAMWTDSSCTVVIDGRMTVGSRPRRYTIPVCSPACYAAALFREYLQAEGIRVGGKARVGAAPGKTHQLAENRDPIAAVLTAMNKESDNFAAEMVLRVLGAENGGSPGTAAKGVRATNDFLDDIGVPRASHRICDGSGMSHQNAVSADAFVGLLRYIYTRRDLFGVFYSTLPSAGVDGTLQYRMNGTEAAGNLRAKTGTLKGVTSLAGYVKSADDELLVFSITSQDFSSGRKRYKSLQDRIGRILASFSRGQYSGD
jgi:D-alanyl-D-alanine carboxypeptidase/D-alanyl-D-alanine-endopeptidase (penicillin-binding protein 4)